MTLINVVRIAKIVALLAFFLPWVAVSCQNVDVATASGIELMQGRMTENPQFESQVKKQMNSAFGGLGDLGGDTGSGLGATTSSKEVPELGVNFFAIAAAAVILIGLGLTFTARGKTAGRNALVTSLIGLALVFATVWWFKDSAVRDMERKEGGTSAAASPFGGSGMGAMGQQMIDSMLQERMGYWLALIALAVAAGAGGLAMAGAPTRPEQTPPAS